MKKTLKVLAALLPIFAITACENLGPEVSEKDYKERLAGIQAEEKKASSENPDNTFEMPTQLTVDVKTNSVLETSVAGKKSKDADAEYCIGKVDFEKGYVYSKIGAKNDNGDTYTENWAYLNDDGTKFINASYDSSKKAGVYSEVDVPKDSQEYADELQAIYEKTIATYINSDAIAELEKVFTSVVSDLQKAGGELKVKYYSKNEGNVSIKEELHSSAKHDGDLVYLSAKIDAKFVATIDNFIMSNISMNVSGNVTEGKGDNAKSMTVKATASLSVKKGCSKGYPNLSSFTKEAAAK